MPPLVIAAWQALYRHSKSPHSFSFLIVSEEIIIIIIIFIFNNGKPQFGEVGFGEAGVNPDNFDKY